jgi:hypothetical protein
MLSAALTYWIWVAASLQSLGLYCSRRFDALFHEFVDLGLQENADRWSGIFSNARKR